MPHTSTLSANAAVSVLCTDGSTTKGSRATCYVLNNDHSKSVHVHAYTYLQYIYNTPPHLNET